jgi:hypothetical protein
MRIPFMAGFFDRTKDRTRVVVAEGRTPRVFPGPWRLEAVVREDSEEERARAPIPPPSPIPPPARDQSG